MRPMQQQQTQQSVQSPTSSSSPSQQQAASAGSAQQKVMRMGGVPTPFGPRPEYIQLQQQQQQRLQQQQQAAAAAAAAAQMSRSYTARTSYSQMQYPEAAAATAAAPGRRFVLTPKIRSMSLISHLLHRYMSENELLEGGQIQLPPAVGSSAQYPAATTASDPAGSPQRNYYVWKEPPTTLPPAYDQYGNQIQVQVSQQQQPQQAAAGVDAASPPRHASYASQVGYYLQQQAPVIEIYSFD